MTFESRHIGNRRTGSNLLLRIASLVAILFTLIILVKQYFSQTPDGTVYTLTSADYSYVPISSNEIIRHSTFQLSYNKKFEQADWVAYSLNAGELAMPSVGRTDWFEEDKSISSGSAHFKDYKNSGYSKGHLIPSADRTWNREVNKETFLMSNISPQKYSFNGGIWRELEENVRDWARENKELFVVTGPVFGRNPKTIGNNKVAVPESFFKVILDASEPGIKAIAFLIPNNISTNPLSDYAMTVDELEEKLDMNIKANFWESDYEEKVEDNLQLELWPIDENRYQDRINIWNKN
ncbi:DNA/RNA non-specific endonuclease [Membranihabitans marinus]|uniref:DNA/RNA non-specific endonuclease n=1 Tax=Membranihabitans marinus TaxID=1227546 RepID=UPI001F4315DD|nr:DNA/RNA non-specific endonuclease [Membranihabitans marinus]